MNPLYSHHDSPVGRLLIRQHEEKLTGLWMTGARHAPQINTAWKRDDDAFDEIRTQLDAYFSGTLTHFDLPLQAYGTTFEQRVWAALQQIPYGQIWTYTQLAQYIGQPTAARAVGAANGHNPISIIVPCHRVIGADKNLTGYAGGLDAKRWLLTHEAAHL